MTGAELMTRAAIILNDADHIRWPLAELAMWINDGQQAIVFAKPSAHSQSVVIDLAVGTLQSLGAGHLLLLRMPRNIVSVGPPRVGGRAIRPTTREMLDTWAPDWHDSRCHPFDAEVRQYVYDEAEPDQFYVYPGNDGTGKVEALVAMTPTALAPTGDPETIGSWGNDLALADPYGIILLDYVLYRAFSKDDMDGSGGRAALHYQAFSQALGTKAQAESGNSPNARAAITKT